MNTDPFTYHIIRKNDKVRVIKGRKFPIGTEGTVFWTSATEDAYGVWKIGVITTTGDKIYINDANVELVEAAPVNPFANKPVIEHGGQVVVFGGKMQQDGGLDLFTCGKCGREIVRATSTRTGNKYWCEVFGDYNDKRFYVKHALHSKENCDAKIKENQEMTDYITKQISEGK